MAKLVVKLHGKDITSLQLEEGQEYIAGRNADCSIVLEGQKSISRQHLKFFQQEGAWVVTLLSRFGRVTREGIPYETLPLNEDLVFTVAPYDFHFTLVEAEVAPPDVPAATYTPDESNSNLPTLRNHNTMATTGNSEATVAGVSSLVPFLKLSNRNTGHEEILKLEGHLWVAGRDPSCEIQIDDGRASRRHFELMQTGEGFFVTDLGSANGTLLNDEALPANEAYQLTSGDILKVSNVTVQFEVRDSGFQSRLQASANLPAPIAPPEEELPVPAYEPPANAAVVKLDPNLQNNWHPNDFDTSMMPPTPPPPKRGAFKVRIVIGLLLAALLYGLFSENQAPPPPKEGPPNTSESASSSVTFEQLKPEQQRAVKDSFALARTMYLQSKYELCLAELKKLHEIVPAYDESKDLANRCDNGAANLLKIRDRERQQQEEAENVRVINMIVENCRRKMTTATTVDQIRQCLAQAIERSPEHPGVRELEQVAQVREDQRKHTASIAEAQRQRKAAGQHQYDLAKGLYQSGKVQQAIVEYEKFLRGSYPGFEAERGEAQRNIAAVKKQFSDRLASLVAECKEYFEKQQFRSAVLSCDKALKEDPNQSAARQMRSHSIEEMRKELKSIYEDSVLEESMGNVDGAKEKWKQIMEKSVPGDEYFNRAKRNLDKYGKSL